MLGLRGGNTGFILRPMKTAISIPDETFEAAERVAKRLGVTRSELYATAVREFIERRKHEGITERLDAVFGDDPEASELDERLQALQAASLDEEDW